MRKIMNKSGKQNMVAWMIGIVAIVALLVFVAYPMISQNTSGNTVEQIIAAGGCETEPYITNNTFNEYSRGTGVGVVYSYVLDGSDASARTLTPGSSGTTFSIGDKGQILSVLTGYNDRVDNFEITKCGGNEFTNYISEGDTITLALLTKNFATPTNIADASSAVNLTDGGASTSATFYIEVQGTRDKSTGQVLLTLEANSTEVDTISINADSSGAKVIESNSGVYDGLDLFVAEGTAPSTKFAFVVDSAEDGEIDRYQMTATAESGEILGAGDATGFLYVNAYAGQWFTNPDGEFEFGWEDADGTAKYEQKASDSDALFS